MPLQPMQFQPEQLGEMLLKGLTTGQGLVKGAVDTRGQYLKNAIQQQYGMPQAAADLQKSQLYNQYYGRDMESQIGMHDALAGLYGKQAQEVAYKLAHPELFQTPSSLNYSLMGLGGGVGAGGGGGGMQSTAMPQQASAPQQQLPQPQEQQPQGWQAPQQPANRQMLMLSRQLMMQPGMQQLMQPINMNDAVQQQAQQPPQQDLIPGTKIPKTGNPYRDSYIAQNFPDPEEKAKLEAQRESQKKFGELEATRITKAQDKAEDKAEEMEQLRGYADEFKQNYDNTSLTGAWNGNSYAYTSAAQGADVAANNMQKIMAAQLGGRTLSDARLKFAGDLKLNRSMNEETVQRKYNNIVAFADRIAELPAMRSIATNMGYSKDQTDLAIRSYLKYRPPYDVKTGANLTENANTFEDFITPEALESYKTKGWYQPPTQAELEKRARGEG